MEQRTNRLATLEKALLSRIPKKQMKEWMHEYALPYRELMAYYNCAMMQVETKFRVISISASPATMDSTMSASCSGSESCG